MSEGESDVMVQSYAISSASETLASPCAPLGPSTPIRAASSGGVVTEDDPVLRAAELSSQLSGTRPNQKLGNEVTVLDDAKAPAAETLAWSWPSSEAPTTSRRASSGRVVTETDGVLSAANLSPRHNGMLPVPTQELENDVARLH